MRYIISGTLLCWAMYCVASIHDARTTTGEWFAFLVGSLSCAAALSLICERRDSK